MAHIFTEKYKCWQLTSWMPVTEKNASLCIAEIYEGPQKGKIVLIRNDHDKTFKPLEDADKKWMQEVYDSSEKLYNYKPLKFEIMTAEKKATSKTGSTKKSTPAKKPAAKKPAAKKEKKVGVIGSIQEFITAGPIKESALLKKLVKRFPKREEASMLKTIKAQIGSNKRPVRMEREKGIKLNIEVNEKTKEKTYSVK